MILRSAGAACALLAATAFAAETPAPPATAPAPVSPVESAAAAPAAKSPITFSQCHVDGPYIAMTYDDGPHAANTPRLLDMLKQRNIKATFFVVSHRDVGAIDMALGKGDR